ncbi:MAG: DUF2254 domain-containing protein [Granulicella sp.]
MRTRLRQFLDQLRTGFWFLPSLMLFVAAGFALLLLFVDERVDPGIKASLPWAYSGGPEGARSLLSTIAGSMITAASVTFSLASVALSIASQQYGSRVLRNFMRDRITQILLGTFVSTFIYSVLVVRSIRGSDFSGGFVPAISVTVAIVLSVISLILLIYFVHHVSTSIQASHIVAVISEDLKQTIPKLYPSAAGRPDKEAAQWAKDREGAFVSISADQYGYLQSIDLDRLMELAKKTDSVFEILIKPGDHYVSGADLVHCWGSSLQPEDQCGVQESFTFGDDRTALQDIRYQFQQLTDVVVRALSPGINDPFTAINGIDALASGISRLAQQPRASEFRQDESETLRLIVPRPSLEGILDDTVGHIAIYASSDRFVMAALKRVLKIVEPHLVTKDEEDKVRHLHADLNQS